MSPSAQVKRAHDRFVTSVDGGWSRHSFSFGSHYDPSNIGFGLLVVSNDDLLQPGGGYPLHRHRDVEIVTWVLEGALAHRDTTGVSGVVVPGLVQRMSAGRGVEHAEFNDAPGRSGALRFVQMWVVPDESGGDAGYAHGDAGPALASGDLVVVASGMPRHRGVAAVGLRQRAAAVHVGRPRAGAAATLPGAPFVHLYVAVGTVDVEGVGRLAEGDAVRLTDEGGRRVVALTDAELVVWEMHSEVGRWGPTS